MDTSTYAADYTSNKKNVAFAVLVFLYEVALCFIYGFVFGFRADFFNSEKDYGGMLLVSILTILLLVGMGLINAYILRSSVTGMGYTLLMYALTVQTFFIFRAFWYKAGTYDEIDSSKTWDQENNIITMSNYEVDRQTTIRFPSHAFVQAIACAIALNIAITPALGRIGLLQIFFVSLFGTFFYQVNAQLMWRWFVTDTGYGYRIFIFGAMLGIVSNCFLRKRAVYQHREYFSSYSHMSLGMFGFLVLWCAFPLLCVAGIFTRTTTDSYILYASPVNMWLALCAGVLGTFVASAIAYRKFSAHDLIFAGLTGGIIFSSSSDVNWNPCVPLIVGFVVSLFTSFKASAVHRKTIKDGVKFSYLHITRFLVPGLVAAILVAVLHAVGDSNNGLYLDNYYTADDSSSGVDGRSHVGQGAFMILGAIVTMAIAALAGVIIGILYLIVNRYDEPEQFNDNVVYSNIPATEQ